MPYFTLLAFFGLRLLLQTSTASRRILHSHRLFDTRHFDLAVRFLHFLARHNIVASFARVAWKKPFWHWILLPPASSHRPFYVLFRHRFVYTDAGVARNQLPRISGRSFRRIAGFVEFHIGSDAVTSSRVAGDSHFCEAPKAENEKQQRQKNKDEDETGDVVAKLRRAGGRR